METVNALDKHNQHTQNKLNSASYTDLVDIAENCKIMREVLDVLEVEAKCKSDIEKLEPKFHTDRTRLYDLESKERNRREVLDKREERRVERRRKLAVLWRAMVFFSSFIITAAVMGWLTYRSWKSLDNAQKVRDISAGEAIGNLFWALFNIILSIAALVAPFVVVDKVSGSMDGLVKNSGQRKWIYHDDPPEIKRLRVEVDEQNKHLDHLRGNLMNLSSKTSSLLKGIKWNDVN